MSRPDVDPLIESLLVELDEHLGTRHEVHKSIEPHFVQGALKGEGNARWVTYRVYDHEPWAVGCAAHLERLARTNEFPGETLPTRTRVVSLGELLEQGSEAVYAAISDLAKRSCRKHVIRIALTGVGKKTMFA